MTKFQKFSLLAVLAVLVVAFVPSLTDFDSFNFATNGNKVRVNQLRATNFNNGTGANAGTFLRGDLTWAAASATTTNVEGTNVLGDGSIAGQVLTSTGTGNAAWSNVPNSVVSSFVSQSPLTNAVTNLPALNSAYPQALTNNDNRGGVTFNEDTTTTTFFTSATGYKSSTSDMRFYINGTGRMLAGAGNLGPFSTPFAYDLGSLAVPWGTFYGLAANMGLLTTTNLIATVASNQFLTVTGGQTNGYLTPNSLVGSDASDSIVSIIPDFGLKLQSGKLIATASTNTQGTNLLAGGSSAGQVLTSTGAGVAWSNVTSSATTTNVQGTNVLGGGSSAGQVLTSTGTGSAGWSNAPGSTLTASNIIAALGTNAVSNAVSSVTANTATNLTGGNTNQVYAFGSSAGWTGNPSVSNLNVYGTLTLSFLGLSELDINTLWVTNPVVGLTVSNLTMQGTTTSSNVNIGTANITNVSALAEQVAGPMFTTTNISGGPLRVSFNGNLLTNIPIAGVVGGAALASVQAFTSSNDFSGGLGAVGATLYSSSGRTNYFQVSTGGYLHTNTGTGKWALLNAGVMTLGASNTAAGVTVDGPNATVTATTFTGQLQSTNVLNRAVFIDNTANNGTSFDATKPYFTLTTNASFTFTAFSGLVSGYRHVFTVTVSNAAASAITITGPTSARYIGAVSTNSLSLGAAKLAYYTLDICPTIWTNVCNVAEP